MSCIRIDSLECDQEDCTPEFCKEPIFATKSFAKKRKEKNNKQKKVIQKLIHCAAPRRTFNKLKKLAKKDNISFHIIVENLLDYVDDPNNTMGYKEEADKQPRIPISAESLKQLRAAKKSDFLIIRMCSRAKKYISPKKTNITNKNNQFRKEGRKQRVKEVFEMFLEEEFYKDYIEKLEHSDNIAHQYLHKKVMKLLDPDDATEASSFYENVDPVDGHSL